VTDAVFHLEGERHVPTELARGPWDPNAQHGGAAAAILGRAVERFEPELGLAVTRITFEILRPVPLVPLVVTTAMTRPGRRVQLVTASLDADGVELVRATALRVLAVPPDIPDGLDPPDRPPPHPSAAAPIERLIAQERPTNFSDAFELRLADGQPFGTPGPSTMWFRLRVPVVAGEEPSPLQRLLVASDFGNGISGVLDYERFVFINPDLTVYVRRPPGGVWVGLDAGTWLEPGAGGYAESVLYDERGRIGRAVQALYVAPR
jgi:acyl-Coa thioesterase superfamily protein/acyl-CoA thioesterase superfamily protein